MEEPQPAITPGEGAAAVAQPPTEVQPPAGEPIEPTSQQPVAQVDDTADWLSKKGLDPSDPEFGMKIAKSYREAEKLALRAAEEASELKKALTQAPQQPTGNGDPLMQEFVSDYRRDKLINDFKGRHGDWQEHEPAMEKLLTEEVYTPDGVFKRSEMVHAGYLSLEDVYLMAKASAPSNTEQVKEQAKQEVLQTLANQQRAGGGNPNANNPSPQTPNSDPIMEAIKRGRAS